MFELGDMPLTVGAEVEAKKLNAELAVTFEASVFCTVTFTVPAVSAGVTA